MKKVLAIIISLSMCMSLAVSPALATNISKIDSKQTSHNSLLASKSTIDLSQSNDTVKLDVNADDTVSSDNLYRTNSKQIKIKLKSSHNIAVKVALYDSSGRLVGRETKNLGTILNTTWTLSSLSQSDTYYFTIENLGQRDVTISGTVTD